jgi:hypothetical protein
MTISTLTWPLGTATLVTVMAPLVLIIYWIRDLLKGRLW